MNTKFYILLLIAFFTSSKLSSQSISTLKYDAEYKNDPWSQNKLGLAYENGEGVAKNANTAFSWFQKAANNGYKYAFYNLGRYYQYGLSVQKDISKAFSMYEQAANQGDMYGARNLAYKYKYGNGVQRDINKAVFWFEKSALHNDETSYQELIYAYSDLKDNSSLYRVASKGCELHFKSCMNTLAYCYAKGEGVPVDFKKAISIINEAISIYPNDPNLYDSKGEILWLKGSKKDAKRMWEQVKSMSPTFYQEFDSELNKYIRSQN